MLSGVSAVSPVVPTVKSSAVRRVVKAPPAKNAAAKNKARSGQLTDAQKAQVDNLRKIDREVKAHEQAHKNAGGQYAGSASFSYVVGPDGKRYAVAGEVPIDVSPVKNNPAATIAKMTVVVAAALAPAQPSGQDQRVAAQANALAAQAQSELIRKSQEKISSFQATHQQAGNSPTSKAARPQATHQQAAIFGQSIVNIVSARAAYNAGTENTHNSRAAGNILNIIR